MIIFFVIYFLIRKNLFLIRKNLLRKPDNACLTLSFQLKSKINIAIERNTRNFLLAVSFFDSAFLYADFC